MKGEANTHFRGDSSPSQRSASRDTRETDFCVAAPRTRRTASTAVTRKTTHLMGRKRGLYCPPAPGRCRRSTTAAGYRPPDVGKRGQVPASAAQNKVWSYPPIQSVQQRPQIWQHIRATREESPQTRKEHQFTEKRTLDMDEGGNHPSSPAMGAAAESSSSETTATAEENKLRVISCAEQQTRETDRDLWEARKEALSTQAGKNS